MRGRGCRRFCVEVPTVVIFPVTYAISSTNDRVQPRLLLGFEVWIVGTCRCQVMLQLLVFDVPVVVEVEEKEVRGRGCAGVESVHVWMFLRVCAGVESVHAVLGVVIFFSDLLYLVLRCLKPRVIAYPDVALRSVVFVLSFAVFTDFIFPSCYRPFLSSSCFQRWSHPWVPPWCNSCPLFFSSRAAIVLAVLHVDSLCVSVQLGSIVASASPVVLLMYSTQSSSSS